MRSSREYQTDTDETMSVGDSEGGRLKVVPNFGMNESPFKRADYPINLKNFAYNCLKLADKQETSSRSDKEVPTMTTLNNFRKCDFVKNTKGHYLTANIGDNYQGIRDSRLDTYNSQNSFDHQIFKTDSESECPGFFPQKSSLMQYQKNVIMPDNLTNCKTKSK